VDGAGVDGTGADGTTSVGAVDGAVETAGATDADAVGPLSPQAATQTARTSASATRAPTPLTRATPRPDDPGVDDELDPREAARDRRRDHDAEAARRALMRPGMGKVFKQILDRQARDADEPPPPRRGRRKG
jgi:hypothetical protein